MGITVKEELNPVFETLTLAFSYHNREALKPVMVEELNKIGFDGESLVRDHLGFLDDYIEAFGTKYRPHQDADLFFGDIDSQFFYYPTLTLLEYPQCIADLESIPKETLREYLGENLDNEIAQAPPPGNAPMSRWIEFVEGLEWDHRMKWLVLLLIENPHRYLKSLIEIYEDNKAGYEEATKALAPLIGEKIRAMKENISRRFLGLAENLTPDGVVYPSLSAPISQLIASKVGIYGLFSDELPDWNLNREKDKEVLLMALKAISDKSKFDILVSLKEAPKYNREIAQELNLTPATTSHHMNTLLCSNLVTVEKRSGKVYYRPATEEIERTIDYLKRYLLDK